VVVTHILVLAAFLALEGTPPVWIKPFPNEYDCQRDAERMNHEYKEKLNVPSAKALGLQYVCMKIIGDL
jgi:tRNA (Thr-GGU) A37 N-methylase